MIASANPGGYDAEINNQFWACDFPRSAGAPTAFGADLEHYVSSLLAPCPEQAAAWAARLREYELAPPAGTHLIMSIPGKFEREDARRYGFLALQRHLTAALAGRPAAQRPARIEYACSSIGMLTVDVHGDIFKAMKTGAQPDAPLRVVWPSLTTMLAISKRGSNRFAEEGGVRWWESLGNRMTGPSWNNWSQPSFPKDRFAHHSMPWESRTRTFHHCKMVCGLTDDSDVVWTYSGSHNLSGAAWGKADNGSMLRCYKCCMYGHLQAECPHAHGKVDSELTAADRERLRTVPSMQHPDPIITVMSWELGILHVPPAPRPRTESLVPWVTPALPYGDETVPWSADSLRSLMKGAGGFGDGSLARVSRASECALRLAGGADAAARLPPLLHVVVAEMRGLRQLRVIGAAPLPLHPELPRERDGRRLLPKDFKAAGSYDDMGVHVPAASLVPGTVVAAVRAGEKYVLAHEGGRVDVRFWRVVAGEHAGRYVASAAADGTPTGGRRGGAAAHRR